MAWYFGQAIGNPHNTASQLSWLVCGTNKVIMKRQMVVYPLPLFWREYKGSIHVLCWVQAHCCVLGC